MENDLVRNFATPTQLSIIAKAVDAYCEQYGIKDTHNREQIALRVFQGFQQGAISSQNINPGVTANVIAFAKDVGIPIDRL